MNVVKNVKYLASMYGKDEKENWNYISKTQNGHVLYGR